MDTQPEHTLNRRTLLKGLGVSAFVLATRSLLGETLDEDVQIYDQPKKKETIPGYTSIHDAEKPSEEKSEMGAIVGISLALAGLHPTLREKILTGFDNFIEEYVINPAVEKYGETVRSSANMLVINILAATLFSAIGGKPGNAGMSELFSAIGGKPGNAGMSEYHKKLKSENKGFSPRDIYNICVVAPLIEEAAFRGLIPFINSKIPIFSENFIKYYSTLVFGYAHNLTNSGFNTEYVPAQQLSLGLFFFYLKEKRGLPHSIVSHSAHNSIAFGIYTVRQMI